MLQAYVDGTVFGRPFGEAPAQILWLHGWGRSSADFTAAGDRSLARGVSSVAIDLPGFGASPPFPEPVGARGYAARLADLLGPADQPGLVVVGHSFGGLVAVGLAANHPDRVRGLVLVASPLVRQGGGRPAARFRWARRLHRAGLVSDRAMERARQRHGSRDYAAATPAMRAVLVATLGESFEDELRRWRGPTALLWGAEDRTVPWSVAEAARACLGDHTTLASLPNVGHLIVTEAPDAVADAALALL